MRSSEEEEVLHGGVCVIVGVPLARLVKLKW